MLVGWVGIRQTYSNMDYRVGSIHSESFVSREGEMQKSDLLKVVRPSVLAVFFFLVSFFDAACGCTSVEPPDAFLMGGEFLP